MLRTSLLHIPKSSTAMIRLCIVHPNAIAFALTVAMACALGLATQSAFAQDWGRDPSDDWSTPRTPVYSEEGDAHTGWSARAGIGFTADPDTLLLNFELPYAFDRLVFAGPMFQVGLNGDERIFAPTANVGVTIPDLPGEKFDRLHPFALIGMGFAVLEDDDRSKNKTSAGFLITLGIGVEYQLSDRFYLGSQMMFNILPEETLDEKFFYSWQVGGMRITF